MEKPILTPFYLIAAALVGIGDTLFLSYYQYLNLVPGCAIGGCEKVLTSSFASILGVHLSYFGLVYYAYMLGLAFLVAIDPRSRALRFALLAYTGVGLLCSIAFETIQITILGAICMYCAISALTTLVLFALSVWHYKITKHHA